MFEQQKEEDLLYARPLLALIIYSLGKANFVL